ncbi:MAG: putative FKBP-type peptidyl-prolyl cis-trans isomerase [Methanomassiliicoccales archaeon PtaU1.Bin124]|nr:MAG: putative FKBP-type peptidyl-prolyl cis-trans isomerase [Methanomassiliicoccales archaeon PtaU1.Bin124]
MSSGKKVSKGDIIRFEFDAWIAESGEMFDTTNEATAKDAGIFNEKFKYVPMPILVGGGRIFEGLEEALVGAKVGEEVEVVIPAAKAAGPRDPKLIQTHAVREFLKQNVEPRPGMEVNLNNKIGFIISVSAGRVRIDFNRRFAGMDLKYKFKVLDIITADDEKVKAVVEMDYGTAEGFKVTVDGKKVSIVLPDVCKYDQKWTLSKYKVVADLREALQANPIEYVEEYLKQEEKVPEELGSEEDKN